MKKYTAFTLIEMLIVMGIIMILMGVVVGLSRWSIQRAGNIEHQNAAENLYEALVKFRNEEGYFPQLGSGGNKIEEEFFAYALGYRGDNAVLLPYISREEFEGGSDTTFYYDVDDIDGQTVLVCVAFGGIDDEGDKGFYCTGNGLGYLPSGEGTKITQQDIDADTPMATTVKSMDDSDWVNGEGFAASLNE
jgi:type II secretory pathway pseudopilin PulG